MVVEGGHIDTVILVIAVVVNVTFRHICGSLVESTDRVSLLLAALEGVLSCLLLKLVFTLLEQ